MCIVTFECANQLKYSKFRQKVFVYSRLAWEFVFDTTLSNLFTLRDNITCYIIHCFSIAKLLQQIENM